MAKAFLIDLRERVLKAVDGGLLCHQAAERFGVSASSAIRWHDRRRRRGFLVLGGRPAHACSSRRPTVPPQSHRERFRQAQGTTQRPVGHYRQPHRPLHPRKMRSPLRRRKIRCKLKGKRSRARLTCALCWWGLCDQAQLPRLTFRCLADFVSTDCSRR